jgi:hypothetical protein
VGEVCSHYQIVEACFVSSSSSMFEFLPSSHYTDVLWALGMAVRVRVTRGF